LLTLLEKNADPHRWNMIETGTFDTVARQIFSASLCTPGASLIYVYTQDAGLI
jgi:hypothetical protein